MRRLILIVPVLLTAGLLAAGCADSTTTTLTTPTVTSTTTTFTGVLKLGGAASYSFAATAAGTVTVTLTAEAPDATVPIGLSLGTWNGSACAIQITNEKAVQGTILTGLVSGPGLLCVRVADSAGAIVNAVSYQVDVVHP